MANATAGWWEHEPVVFVSYQSGH